jgi:hypothetical protein
VLTRKQQGEAREAMAYSVDLEIENKMIQTKYKNLSEVHNSVTDEITTLRKAKGKFDEIMKKQLKT